MLLTQSASLFYLINRFFFLYTPILTTQFLLQTTNYRFMTINYRLPFFLTSHSSLRRTSEGVGWGLAGGSEGSTPLIPQETPRKDLPKSLYRETKWIHGTGIAGIEKKEGKGQTALRIPKDPYEV